MENIRKTSAIFGVILGVATFALGILSMYAAKSANSFLAFHASSFVFGLLIPLGIVIFLVLRLRKINGGYWGYRQALENIFIVLVVSVVISTVGTHLFNVAVPQVQQDLLENSMEINIEQLEAFGMDNETLDTMVDAIEEQKEQVGSFSLGQIFQGIMISTILSFVFALILAAIFKKEKPIFIQEDKDL